MSCNNIHDKQLIYLLLKYLLFINEVELISKWKFCVDNNRRSRDCFVSIFITRSKV